MKCFVRTSDLDEGGEIEVLAFYDDDTDVPAEAHGSDTRIITVDHGLLTFPMKSDGTPEMPRIPADWRERSRKVFPLGERTKSVYELVNFILEHGADVSQWPQEAKDRYDEIQNRWKP
jgi:hypothetical protein